MDIKEVVTWSGASSLLTFLVGKLLRREVVEHRQDAATQQQFDRLNKENTDLLAQLAAKEETIQRLIKEKEQILTQLAEIPILKDRIEEQEGKLDNITSIMMGMNRFITHLMLEVDWPNMPEELIAMIKEELPALQAGAAGAK